MKSRVLNFRLEDKEYEAALMGGISKNFRGFICKCNDENACDLILDSGDFLLVPGSNQKIYKYQNVRSIAYQLAEALGMDVMGNYDLSSVQTISLVDAEGGAGSSTLAKALAEVMGTYYEKKVLVINHSDYGYGIRNINSEAEIIFESEEAWLDGKKIMDMLYRDALGNLYFGANHGMNLLRIESLESQMAVYKMLIQAAASQGVDLVINDFGSMPLTELAERIRSGGAGKLVALHRGEYNELRIKAMEEYIGAMQKDPSWNFDLHVVNAVSFADERENQGVIYVDFDESLDLTHRYGTGVLQIAEKFV